MNILAQVKENQEAAGIAAGRLWWHWRHAFLAAKHQPNDAPALLATLDSDVLAMFEGVYRARLAGARMEQPEHADVEQDVLAALTKEADEGHVPLHGGADGYVAIEPVPTRNPFDAPAAALARPALAARAERFRVPIVGVAAVLVLVFLWAWLIPNPRSHAASPPPTPTPSAEASSLPRLAAATVRNTLPGTEDTDAPASIELGAVVYRVVPTYVEARQWVVSHEPGVASWLDGTIARPVLCVPTLADIDDRTPVRLRDTTGAIRTFKITEQRKVQRHQIEVLSQRTVGLTLLECGGVGNVRSVVFATYVPGD